MPEPRRPPSGSPACCESRGPIAFGRRRDAPGRAGTTSRRPSRSFCSSPLPTGSPGCGWGRMASCPRPACPRRSGAVGVFREVRARGWSNLSGSFHPAARARVELRTAGSFSRLHITLGGRRATLASSADPCRPRPHPATSRDRRAGTTPRTAVLRLRASPTPFTSAPRHVGCP